MRNQVVVIATFRPKPGQEAATERVLRDMLEPSRGEPGCVRYDLYQGGGAAACFVLFEIYRDRAAVDAHRGTEHYKAYRQAISDLLSEPIHVEVLRGLDVARG